MTDRTHHHCQCDNCDGEDCKDLPMGKSIHGYDTKELVDELCKREDVTKYIVTDDEKDGHCYLTNGRKKSEKIWGKATILVVKI